MIQCRIVAQQPRWENGLVDLGSSHRQLSFKGLSFASLPSESSSLSVWQQLCKIDISLSQRFSLWFLTFVAAPFFYSISNHFFGVGLPAYLSYHNLFLREHISVGFNEFPSLLCWDIVIHHHRPQGPSLFWRVKWDVCTDTVPPVLIPIRED